MFTKFICQNEFSSNVSTFIRGSVALPWLKRLSRKQDDPLLQIRAAA